MLKKTICMVLSVFLIIGSLNISCKAADNTDKDGYTNYKGHLYKVFNDEMNWFEAKQYCESLGGHLATITSSKENEVIQNLPELRGGYNYWLGGTDLQKEDDWRWITGEKWKYTCWGGGQPDNYQLVNGIPEHYLQINYDWGMYWNDSDYIQDNTAHIGFICEWENSELLKLSLMEAEYIYGVNKVDLLHEVLSIEPQHGKFSLVCSAANKNLAKKYEIYSGNKKIAESTNGEFKDVDPSVFKEEEPVSVVVTGDKGKISTTLLLEVKSKNVLTDTSVGLGGSGISLTLPDSVPLIGGSYFKFNLPNVPLTAVIEDGKIKVGYNIKKKELYSYNSYEGVTTTTNKKKTMAQKIADWKKDMYKTQLISKDIKGYLEQANQKADIPGLEKSCDFTVFGYAEGTWSDSIETISGELVIAISGSVSGQKQFAICNVPMTVRIDITGKGEADAKVTYSFIEKKLSGSLNLGASVTLEPYLGVGVGTWLSAGIYGKAEVGVKVNVVSGSRDGIEGPGLDSVYLYGEAGLKAYFAKKEVGKIELVSTKNLKKTGLKDYINDSNQLLLYSRKENSVLNKNPKKTTDNNSTSTENFSQKTIGTDVFNSENLDDIFVWNETDVNSKMSPQASGDGTSLLIDNIYGSASPQIATIGDKVVIAYIDNESGRALANQTAAKYIIYDKNNKTYTDSKIIVDDSTADFDLHMMSDGKNLYAYYLDSTEEFGQYDDPSIEDYAGSFAVRVAKYNSLTNRFENINLIRLNSYYCYAPVMSLTDDGFILAWVENPENNIFGLSDDNYINYAIYDGNTLSSPETIVMNLNSVSSLSVGNNDKNVKIVYCVDEDNDITTDNEELYITDTVGNSKLVTSGSLSALSYVKLPGTNKYNYACINDGVLSYIDESTNTVVPYAENALIGKGSTYKVVGDKIYYLNIESADGNTQRNVAMMTYDSGKCTSVNVTEEDSYVDAFSTDGENVLYLLTSAEISDDSDINTTSQLKLKNSMEKHSIKLDYIDFDSTEVVPGKELPIVIHVKNDGTEDTSEIQVDICDGDDVVSSQTISVDLTSGEESDVNADIKIPSDIDGKNYTIRVIEPGYENDNDENSKTAFDISYTDLSVDAKYVIDSLDRSIMLNVQNESSVGTNADIVVADEDGNNVFEESCYLSGNDMAEYQVPLTEEMIPSDNTDTVYTVSVSADTEEYYDCNNVAEVRVWNIDPVSYIIENFDNSEFEKAQQEEENPTEEITEEDYSYDDDDSEDGGSGTSSGGNRNRTNPPYQPVTVGNPPVQTAYFPVGTRFYDNSHKTTFMVNSASGTVALVKPEFKTMKKYTVPETISVSGVTYRVTEIKANAFKNNKQLKSVVIGSNVEKIGSKAFYGCKKLSKITIKTKKLTSKTVGKKAFGKIYKKPVVKVPKGKKKAYKKWIYKKGLTKKAKIK